MTLVANETTPSLLRVASAGATILEARTLRDYVGTDGKTWPRMFADEFTNGVHLLGDNEDGFGWYPRYAASGPETSTGYWPVVRDGGGALVYGGFSTNAGEFQQYLDPRVPEYAAHNPFSTGPSTFKMTLAARPAGIPINDTQWQPFTSGCLISYLNGHGFQQQYGYFEARIKLPPGYGCWPAFWMLASNGFWPPEIDILERFSGYPINLIATTAHSRRATPGFVNTGPLYDGQPHYQDGLSSFVAETSDGFHTYGMEWTPTTLTWFFDRVAIHVANTPSDMHQPFYLLLNLAGDFNTTLWPTNLPFQMEWDWVRVWAMPR